MNALLAALITIGLLVLLGAVGAALSQVDWDNIWDIITTEGCLRLFLILCWIPIPVMFYGVVTYNLWAIILAEAVALFCTGFVGSSNATGPFHLPLLVPSILGLIGFIIHDQVLGAIILSVLGFCQLPILFRS